MQGEKHLNDAQSKNELQSMHYVQSLNTQKEAWTLEHIQRLLDGMGNPQKQLRYIHITGTNGKGSTASFISAILRQAGFRTGLFTSPYLVHVHEQIQIDGHEISDADLMRWDVKIASVVARMEQQGFAAPSAFERMTALALAYFAEQACDWVVLEVGMGGRLDATNVIDRAEVCVFTPISLDHTQFLGNTLVEIAGEKAGILKPGAWVVTASQEPEVLAVLAERARAMGLDMYAVEREEIRSEGRPEEDKARKEMNGEGQTFSYGIWQALEIRLAGNYQLVNAAVAVEVAYRLQQKGVAITEEHLRKGLQTASWQGRFEILCRNPLCILDGAHNTAGARALKASLDADFRRHKRIFILGMLADKEIEAFLGELLQKPVAVLTVTPQNERALAAEALATKVQELCRRLEGVVPVVQACPSVAAAVAAAFQMWEGIGAEEEVCVCACGSLYLSAEVRACIQERVRRLGESGNRA